jgi:hypothetical protein
MSNPTIRIHNTETDEVIDREMNASEFAKYQKQQEAEVARQAKIEAEANAKSALLDRLGITAEEAALLLS